MERLGVVDARGQRSSTVLFLFRLYPSVRTADLPRAGIHTFVLRCSIDAMRLAWIGFVPTEVVSNSMHLAIDSGVRCWSDGQVDPCHGGKQQRIQPWNTRTLVQEIEAELDAAQARFTFPPQQTVVLKIDPNRTYCLMLGLQLQTYELLTYTHEAEGKLLTTTDSSHLKDRRKSWSEEQHDAHQQPFVVPLAREVSTGGIRPPFEEGGAGMHS
jgi:hypothetical protein